MIVGFGYEYYKTLTVITNYKFMKNVVSQFRKNLPSNIFDYSSVSGFNASWDDVFKELNLLNVTIMDDEIVLSSIPVIGTAISSNHFGPYKEFLQSVEKVYKNKTLIYLYDIGLKYKNFDSDLYLL